ncbi:hypothetical protein Cpir12675_002067 [Ceratocystis pirilliformis]|uniref:Protein phosphatase n=1 Tax=Ceratocystis pirilliformis TaxID=259994 RepID=A0ABR3ZBR6_9PEZI
MREAQQNHGDNAAREPRRLSLSITEAYHEGTLFRVPLVPPPYHRRLLSSSQLQNPSPVESVLPDHSAPASTSTHQPTTSAPVPPIPPSAADSGPIAALPKLPFRFETGIGLFAKRQPRPFPPPFLSPPSGSFSDPLSTHRKPKVDGQFIRGLTNGDDAVYASDYFICANDGVGVWSKRPRGHAGLWSRLILHYWVAAMEKDTLRHANSLSATPGLDPNYQPDCVQYLQEAYERTLTITAGPNECNGTTTASGAQLHFRLAPDSGNTPSTQPIPVVHVTNLGDCEVLIVRPSTHEVLFKSVEEWHWFGCPRQLGTNSPDTPVQNAKYNVVDIQVGDIVLAMSDGVIDNLWEHEIVDVVTHSLERWEANEAGEQQACTRMAYTADALLAAAKVVATDPFAESPFMERAIEMGLASEGGMF